MQMGGARVVHFTLQRDHMHMIVEADDKESLSRGVQGLLSSLAPGQSGQRQSREAVAGSIPFAPATNTDRGAERNHLCAPQQRQARAGQRGAHRSTELSGLVRWIRRPATTAKRPAAVHAAYELASPDRVAQGRRTGP